MLFLESPTLQQINSSKELTFALGRSVLLTVCSPVAVVDAVNQRLLGDVTRGLGGDAG